MARSTVSRRSLSISLFALLATAAPAFSQTTYTWTGGDLDDNWFSSLNWSAVGPVSPPPLSNLNTTFVVLSGNNQTTNTLDYSFSANSLTFAASAGAFVVNQPASPDLPQTLTLGTGGITVLSNNNQTFNANLALGAAQTWSNQGSGTLTVGGAVDNGGFLLTADGSGNSIYNGVISGAGGLTKNGAGTLVLGGANTYSGGTTVNVGVVVVTNATGLGSTSGSTTVASGAAVQVSGAINVGEPITLNGTGIANDGALRKTTNNAITWSGAITLGTGGARINSDANTFTISGGISGAGQPLTIGGAGNTTISGAITTGTGGTIVKDGSGTLTLSNGSNNFAASGTGSTVITIIGGILSQGGESSGVAGTNSFTGVLPTAVTPSYVFINGGTLQSTRVGVGVTFLNKNKGITLGPNGGSLDVTDTTSGDLNIYDGVVTGVGGLTKAGPVGSVLAMTAANTYQGPTTVAGGTLRVRTNNNVFPTSTALTVNSNAIFDLNGLSQQVGSLSGAGTVNVGNGTFTVGDSTTTTFSGVIGNTSGNGKVTKVGSGTLTLTGVNTYTGATTVSAGSLAIGTGGSLAAGSTVGVSSSGTLAGGGTVNGVVIVSAGGAIRGGTTGTIGTLTVANNVTINSTAGTNGILRFEGSRTGTNAANASLISVTGSTSILNLNSGGTNKFTIDLVNGTDPLQLNETYTLTLATVATAGNIQLNGSPAPAAIDPSNYILQSSAFASFSNVSLTVNGGTSLQLTFTPVPVPEPTIVLAIAACAMGLGGLVRRWLHVARCDRIGCYSTDSAC